MRTVTRFLLGLLAIFLLIQFIPIIRTNPDDRRHPGTSPEVTEVLRRACYDCHSNETVWPWYSYVAPVSWLITNDVEHGRHHFNLSNFEDLSDETKVKVRDAAKQLVREDKMPLWFYLPLHPEARLSERDRAIIESWK